MDKKRAFYLFIFDLDDHGLAFLEQISSLGRHKNCVQMFFILPLSWRQNIADGLSFLSSVFGRQTPSRNRYRTFPRKPEEASCRNQSTGAAEQPFLQFHFSNTSSKFHVRPVAFLPIVNSLSGGNPQHFLQTKRLGAQLDRVPVIRLLAPRACIPTGKRLPGDARYPMKFDDIRLADQRTAANATAFRIPRRHRAVARPFPGAPSRAKSFPAR